MRHDMRWTAKFVAVAIALSFGFPASAGDPSAIVEDIDAPGAKLQFMDYVESGRVISLGASGTVTLGYLRSCLHETIIGGRVTVGHERSRVDGGTVERERVECDGGKLKLTAEQAGKSAVLVLRRPPGSPATARQRPAFTIYGASPVIKLTGGAREVAIKRLDRPGKEINIAVPGDFIDLSARDQSLEPGGIYRARSGNRTVVFKVDAFARPGRGPIIGRLIQF